MGMKPKGTNYENMPDSIGIRKPVPIDECNSYDTIMHDKTEPDIYLTDRGNESVHLTTKLREDHRRTQQPVDAGGRGGR